MIMFDAFKVAPTLVLPEASTEKTVEREVVPVA